MGHSNVFYLWMKDESENLPVQSLHGNSDSLKVLKNFTGLVVESQIVPLAAEQILIPAVNRYYPNFRTCLDKNSDSFPSEHGFFDGHKLLNFWF